MSEPTTHQMNEAIALFMDVKPYEDSKYGLLYNSPIDGKTCFSLQYHSSWDWLWPVVEKIANLDDGKYNIHISSTGQWACYISRDDVFDDEITSFGGFEPVIMNVFKAVYQFILWYQKQHPNDTP